ncbi:hypothetical protein BHE74_00004586 [Ensete ventricosum]|nr:hypothetical protein BHE74_00004586 [Ensete ventricosum]
MGEYNGDLSCTSFVDRRRRKGFIGLGKCHPRAFPLSSPPPGPTNPAAPTDLDLDSSVADSFPPAALGKGQNNAHLLPPFGRRGAPPPSTCLATDLVRRSWKPTDLDRRKAGSLSINLDTSPTAPIPAPPPAESARSANEMEETEEEEEEEEEEEGRKQLQGRSLAQSGQRRRRRSRRQPGQMPSQGWDEDVCFRHLHPIPCSSSTAHRTTSSAIDLLAPPILHRPSCLANLSSLWGLFDNDDGGRGLLCGVRHLYTR